MCVAKLRSIDWGRIHLIKFTPERIGLIEGARWKTILQVPKDTWTLACHPNGLSQPLKVIEYQLAAFAIPFLDLTGTLQILNILKMV